jgi:hypothetical protein
MMFRAHSDRYWLVVAEARQAIERLIGEGESLESAMVEGMLHLTALTRFEQGTAEHYLTRNALLCQAKVSRA